MVGVVEVKKINNRKQKKAMVWSSFLMQKILLLWFLVENIRKFFYQYYFLVRRGDLSLSLFHFYKTFHLYITRKRGVILAGSVGVGVVDVVGVL